MQDVSGLDNYEFEENSQKSQKNMFSKNPKGANKSKSPIEVKEKKSKGGKKNKLEFQLV